MKLIHVRIESSDSGCLVCEECFRSWVRGLRYVVLRGLTERPAHTCWICSADGEVLGICRAEKEVS